LHVAEDARDSERAHQVYHYRCLARLELGDMPGVYADLGAQARLADELRQPAQSWYVAAVRATLATFHGRLEEAETLIPEAFALGQRAQGWMAAVYRALQLYALRREQGRLEEVEETVRQIARDFPTYPVVRAVLAQLCTELGRAEDAREIFERLAADDFAAIPRDDEWVFTVSLLAEVAEALRDGPRAASLYSRLLPYAGRNAVSNPDICIGSVSRSLGLLAAMARQWPEAVRHFEDALAMNTATGARPWLARVQYDYARALLSRDDAGDQERAVALLGRALETGRALHLPVLSQRVALLLDRMGAGPPAPRKGVPRDAPDRVSPGGRVLVDRLRRASLSLVAGEEGVGTEAAPETRDLPPAGEILDPEAKAAYRRRLADLEEDAREAEAWRDAERAARAREEMEFLRQELAGAFGLGGRDRRAASAAERARVNVTRAIKAALVRIREHSPDLHHHLDTAIRTGTFCSYTPDPRVPISWQL
jgi:tetratricopeptide (TPR) repeat protein